MTRWATVSTTCGPHILRKIAICLGFIFISASLPAHAEQSIRIASFHTELSRKGPGLLWRDIVSGTDPQVTAVVEVISTASPDILVLQGIDWDQELRTLQALADQLQAANHPFPHLFALRPNAGLATDLDLDGDSRRGGPGDAQGYGAFIGQGGIAILSRFPIRQSDVVDLSALLWRDMPGAQLPQYSDGSPFPSSEAQSIQRLSSTAHWSVPITVSGADQTLNLLTFHATPPVFDGVEDRNGLRNRDEILLWQHYLNGALDAKPRDQAPFILAGIANQDLILGEGHKDAIQTLTTLPNLQDPRPHSAEAGSATVSWPDLPQMRVSYILPSTGLRVRDSGVLWRVPDSDAAARASRHRLVWVDITLP